MDGMGGAYDNFGRGGPFFQPDEVRKISQRQNQGYIWKFD